MTKTDISTKEVLAAIAAKNAWHPATTQNDPADFDITSADRPLPPVVTKGKKPLRKPPQKAKKGKPQEKFDEPNNSEIVWREGVVSYRVQIRRRVDGKQHSLSKTFRHLPNAKKWRNKKLLHIEVNGFPIQIVTETTVSDIIKDRLDRGKTLGRSALQVLNYIKNDDFGKTKVSTLTQQELYDYADLLSADERTWTCHAFVPHQVLV